ncbi:MAG: histidine ammonia-lyase [Chitinophagales bacterium]|nr:histidine ammonia-lyase [Chitinophagales bacterium]
MSQFHIINGEGISLEAVRKIVFNQTMKLELSDNAIQVIQHCRTYLDNKLSGSDDFFYGINTGFGALCNVKIDDERIKELQENLVLSHAAGTGSEMPKQIVKLMMFLKIHSLSFGHSGVAVATVQRLVDMYNKDVVPVVYTQGSLGASGDLAPLAHLVLPIIGKGEVTYNGQRLPGEILEDKFGWKPIELQSKEGLALLNGTQFMQAYGLWSLFLSERLFNIADFCAALSYDAWECKEEPFYEPIHRIRPHKGQLDTAHAIRKLIKGSMINQQTKPQIQDPYSFRCIPQVHGASKDTLHYMHKTFATELNSVTDNPIIFPDEDLILSGGNFHGQPLALAMDHLAIALAELGNISERRTYLMLSGQRGLPVFLAKDPGIHNGLMIAQYTAASIVSQNKQLCTPASVDSIVSSNGQEDHVSMGSNGATKLYQVATNLENILAIEWLTAAQALAFRRPMTTSILLEEKVAAYRNKVTFMEHDRIISYDIRETVLFFREQEWKIE